MAKAKNSDDATVSSLVANAEALDPSEALTVKKSKGPNLMFRVNGTAVDLSHVPKMVKDVLHYANGDVVMKNLLGPWRMVNGEPAQRRVSKARVVDYDPARPLGEGLMPSPTSPLCKQCGLFQASPVHPFLSYEGSEHPDVTVIVDGPTFDDDDAGRMLFKNSQIARIIRKEAAETGVTMENVRWILLTRCRSRVRGKIPNLKIKGNWCRWHLVDDLMRHPPKVIMPVGTVALGALSHKSNAEDWGGKILTYRGWPDDWLTTPEFALPQPDPADPTQQVTGHPVFGPVPTQRTLLYPVQAPHLVFRHQNAMLAKRWWNEVKAGLALVKSGAKPKHYRRPWYEFTEDVERIKDVLAELKEASPMKLAYDTETTGLRPWAVDAQIVSMMFRWVDPATGNSRSLGFPWDTRVSDVRKHRGALKWLIWDVLCKHDLIGHNLTFDVLYTYASYFKNAYVGWDDSEINRRRDTYLSNFAEAAKHDTWHMAYTAAQRRGSLGLEVIAYKYAPELAGYEEDFTLLIELHRDTMHPSEKAQAGEEPNHYLKCPRDRWPTHLEPYVMGDVEVAYVAQERLSHELDEAVCYRIPLALPNHPGRFRWYNPPSRGWVYEKIMSPAARVLMKMMARGLYVDVDGLEVLEKELPKQIGQLSAAFQKSDPAIQKWIEEQLAEAVEEEAALAKKEGRVANPKPWELNLEKKEHLRGLLFDGLKISPDRLTKTGRKLYGEEVAEQNDRIGVEYDAYVAALKKKDPKLKPMAFEDYLAVERQKYAAIDKFTLNAMAVKHEKLRGLLDYRKVFKLYTTYVRPLRNYQAFFDKARKKEPHLCADNCIHASFLLTGTRGGRLCVAGDTQLEVCIDGEKKVVAICDLWKYNNQHVTVKTHRGRWQRIACVYFKGYEHMFEAVTESGCSIKATAAHRVFTELGWQPLGIVARQKLELLVSLASAPGHGAQRAQFSEACAAKTDEFSAGERSDFKARSFTELESLSSFEGRTSSSPLFAAGCRSKGQQERSKAAFSKVVEGAVGAEGSSGYSSRTYCERDGNHAVFSRTEYPDVWVAEIGQRASASQRSDRISIETYGSGVPWVDGGFRILFRRQSGFFPKSVSGLHNAFTAGLVFEGHVPDAVHSLEGGQGWNGGNFVVNESARTGALSRIGVVENSTFSGVRLQWEPACRLWADWHEHIDRSGWGIPHRRAKQSLYSRSRKSGLSSNALQYPSSSVQHADSDCGDTVCFEPVVQWRSVGLQAVWDIEVEGDHSYLAQGIFHHNSCRDPNLQQMPRKGEVKKMFTSRFKDRGCMYQGDLSQIELRLMAATSGDPTMVKAYLDKADLHSLTASRIFDTPYEHFTKHHMEWLQSKGRAAEAKALDENRTIAKTTNFLTGYGGGAFGLQNVLAGHGIFKPIEQCEDIIRAFFESYPSLRALLQLYKGFILKRGCAVSIFGRVRIFEEVWGDDEEAKAKALRAGCNHLIQSTASDMMLVALFAIEQQMRERKLESILVSTVHDSLVVDAVRNELDDIHEIVTTTLNNFDVVLPMLLGDDFDTSWMLVPFTGDMECGLNYLNMQKIPATESVDWDNLLACASA